jgi:hypothetical protein
LYGDLTLTDIFPLALLDKAKEFAVIKTSASPHSSSLFLTNLIFSFPTAPPSKCYVLKLNHALKWSIIIPL